ncbi:Peroxidase 24-like protein [Drosera capensis]
MRTSFPILLVTILVAGIAGICKGDDGELQFGFYRQSFPQAEAVVKNITWNMVSQNPELVARLLRFHFHDCFVEGCDGSVLLDSTPGNTAEKDAIPNLTLGGFNMIDAIKNQLENTKKKTQLEQVCPGVVSCADIVALAARDAVSLQYQHVLWPVFTGRRDGTVSEASEALANLPSPFSDLSTLKQNFAAKGLDTIDLVVLSGAHTIGIAPCAAVVNRLYNFTGKGDADPSLDPNYANFLRIKCPQNFSPSTTLQMDPNSASSFDTHYYHVVKNEDGLFQSDAALLTDPVSSLFVDILQNPGAFFPYFARSMVKMGEIEALTGHAGEIRKNCHVSQGENN